MGNETENLDARGWAWVVAEVVDLGIAQRERNSCLGVELRAWLFAHLGNNSELRKKHTVTRRHLRKALKHSRIGHEPGCQAFGVSIVEIEKLLQSQSRVQVAPLLCEALTSAAEEILDEQQWSAGIAREIVAIHLGRRITLLTPQKNEVGSTLACGAHLMQWNLDPEIRLEITLFKT